MKRKRGECIRDMEKRPPPFPGRGTFLGRLGAEVERSVASSFLARPDQDLDLIWPIYRTASGAALQGKWINRRCAESGRPAVRGIPTAGSPPPNPTISEPDNRIPAFRNSIVRGATGTIRGSSRRRTSTATGRCTSWAGESGISRSRAKRTRRSLQRDRGNQFLRIARKSKLPVRKTRRCFAF